MSGVNYFKRPFEKYFDVVENPPQTAEVLKEPVALSKNEILDKLSTQEKIAQMIAYPLVIDEEQESKGIEFIREFFLSSPENESSESAKNKILEIAEIENLRLDKLSPGFITIFGSEIASESAKQKIIEVKNLYENNLLSPRFAVDHEGGSVQRLNGEGYTQLPSWKDLCELDEIERDDLLRRSAGELKNTGIDIVLAPVLDVGNNNILKDRICSDSYAIVADRSMNYISIFDSYGILPVIKHFPGIGTIKKDLHNNFDFIDVLVNDVKLYKYIIEQPNRVSVMVSHVGIVNQNSQIPCSLSKDCVNELKNAYPNLLVFSDALEMKAASFNMENISEPKSLIQVSKEAIIAGDEVLIYGQSVNSYDMKEIIFNLAKEYDTNQEFKNLVDKAVEKIIDYKYKVNEYED